MKDLLILLAHLLTTIAKLLGPGGVKTIVADSLLMKQQLLIMNRTRRRAPNLSVVDRFLLGFWSLFSSPRHIQRAAVIIRPSTLLKLHRLLKQRKYRLLYSAGRKGKPGPKGPSPELILAIVELKRRNPRFGCPRIAQQINKAFGTDIDKDVVRRILATHYRPDPDGRGPSWLTFLGHTKDSLCNIDLFGANPSYYRATGYLWSWISLRTASSDLASMPAMSMAWLSAECLTRPCHPEALRNTSVLITIHSSFITNGKQT
jgi:hypothetical protein